ncbi:unnamed protein product [Soboliphyme baturini]|uniref:Fibropellin-1 n=1 Tax=Soboliphyme baturini TaxID=241478 RepID=A0A183IB67_9BILA|nr:unnamed protein product [Soboliphyme baturini]
MDFPDLGGFNVSKNAVRTVAELKFKRITTKWLSGLLLLLVACNVEEYKDVAHCPRKSVNNRIVEVALKVSTNSCRIAVSRVLYEPIPDFNGSLQLCKEFKNGRSISFLDTYESFYDIEDITILYPYALTRCAGDCNEDLEAVEVRNETLYVYGYNERGETLLRFPYIAIGLAPYILDNLQQNTVMYMQMRFVGETVYILALRNFDNNRPGIELVLCETDMYTACVVECLPTGVGIACAWTMISEAEPPHGLCPESNKIDASCECPPCHFTQWHEWTYNATCGESYKVRFRPPSDNPHVDCLRTLDNDCCWEEEPEYRGHCPCEQIECQHGGTCMDLSLEEWKCRCVLGYTGHNCEINIDDCRSDSCNYHGTCVDNLNYYTCLCEDGYNGDNCEYGIHTSPPATDIAILVDFLPTDEAGYEDSNQQDFFNSKEVDECLTDSCNKAGRCIDEFNGFRCRCYVGFTGSRCEQNIDDCVGAICQNNGTCVDHVRSYSCECTAGYTGRFCEAEIDSCSGVVCGFHGTCIRQRGGFVCDCKEGFSGEECETKIDHCVGISCGPNGTCVDSMDTYTCVCDEGLVGRACEKPSAVTEVNASATIGLMSVIVQVDIQEDYAKKVC